MFSSVPVGWGAFEVGNGLFGAKHASYRVYHASAFEQQLQQLGVILIVFNYQDDICFVADIGFGRTHSLHTLSLKLLAN